MVSSAMEPPSVAGRVQADARSASSVRSPAHRGSRSRRRPGGRRRGLVGWLYVLPALAFYTFVVVVPTVQSLSYSLYSWDGVGVPKWVGLKNYTSFATDPVIISAFQHTIVLVVFFALIPIALGLVSAALLSRARVRGSGAFRSVIFLPQVLTTVVIAVIWRQLFSFDGVVNRALDVVGLGQLTQPWLGSFTFALPVLGLAGTWTTMGLCMLLFLSGVGNIPTELYDAARVDGAGIVREFFAVTLPGLIPQISVALTLTLIAAIRVFDIVWLTTRGGPGTASITPAVLLYTQAFTAQDIGSAAAIGVTLAVFSLAVALVIARVTDRATS